MDPVRLRTIGFVRRGCWYDSRQLWAGAFDASSSLVCVRKPMAGFGSVTFQRRASPRGSSLQDGTARRATVIARTSAFARRPASHEVSFPTTFAGLIATARRQPACGPSRCGVTRISQAPTPAHRAAHAVFVSRRAMIGHGFLQWPRWQCVLNCLRRVMPC